MSSGPGGEHEHLDASGPREVVYCHQCDNEWYQDEHGLVCPRCEGEITEIVTPEADPRPQRNQPQPTTPPELRSFRNHNPWEDADSDPEEADIEEHITHGPGGSVLFSRTVRSTSRGGFGGPRNRRRRDPFPEEPDPVMRNFQNMIGNLVGPTFQPGRAGVSGPDTMFREGPFGRPPGGGQRLGGTFTFTTTARGQPRNANSGQPGGPDDIATILGNILGPMAMPGEHADGEPRMGGAAFPPGLQALFGAMLNPANARSGDAVYTQEALDQIISTLMEQHPTSNAPGPAPPDAIAALPKKKLDYEMLGPEGKGECSVCMDDVTVGVEVVVLPCGHWFHEACAGAWLGEHNTCPICRKGLESTSTPPSENRRANASAPTSRSEYRARRLSATRPHMSRDNTVSSHSSRTEPRLESIRDVGRLSPTEERQPRRYQLVGDGLSDDSSAGPQMPGAFTSGYRRPSEMSENQRDARTGNTSGSDRSRESRRSSHSGNGGGPIGWIRDRFGSDRRNN